MNPEVKQQWVAALRSGEYKQCEGRLRHTSYDGNGQPVYSYCCLGVLTDLAVKAGAYNEGDGEAQLREENYPPYDVVAWAGLNSHNPYLGDTLAADHNDNGKSFSEIADLIERYL